MCRGDVNWHGRQVLMRVDFNVPLSASGAISDTTRLTAVLPSLRRLLDAGAGVRLISHLGRPKTYDSRFSLKPLVPWLTDALGVPVHWTPAWPDDVMPVPPGEVALADNLRFLAGETQADPALVTRMLNQVDGVVMDAFACAHRNHASTVGLVRQAPVCILGDGFVKELDHLDAFFEADCEPRMAVVGGNKIQTKVQLLESLSGSCRRVAVMGAMSHTFLVVQGVALGEQAYEPEALGVCEALLATGAQQGCEWILPVDVTVGWQEDGQWRSMVKSCCELTPQDSLFDVGPKTLAQLCQATEGMHAIVWNGPLGWYEQPPFDRGSVAWAETLAAASAKTWVGGGDTLAVASRVGLESFDVVSTAGGAMLTYLERRELPVLRAMAERHDAAH